MKVGVLKKKYENLSIPVKAAFWYTICNIVNKGIALISTPIFTRILSEEQYGTFAVFQSWFSILIIFTSLNVFLNGYQKGLLKYKDNIDEFTSSQLGFTTTITIIFIVIYCSNIKFWTKIFELSPVLMAVMFLELIIMPALDLWAEKQRFYYKYKKYVVVSLLVSVLSIAGGILAVINSSYKVEARVYSDVLAKAVFAGPLFVFIFFHGKTFFNKEYWKYALAFNLPLLPHYLSNYVLNQSDRLMISHMIGNTQAAYYSVSYTISSMMMLVVSAINNSLTPYIYKTIDLENNMNIKDIKNVTRPLIILVSGLCIVTMAFAPEVILIFAGKRYMDAVYIIPPVAASIYFIFIYSLFGNIEYFYQKTKLISVATCMSAFFNLILNYIFIEKFGYYAAGYTTLICYMCLAFMHFIFYRKILKEEKYKEDIYDIRVIMLISLITLLIMFMMTITYKNIFIRYTIIIIIISLIIIKRNKLVELLNKFRR